MISSDLISLLTGGLRKIADMQKLYAEDRSVRLLESTMGSVGRFDILSYYFVCHSFLYLWKVRVGEEHLLRFSDGNAMYNKSTRKPPHRPSGYPRDFDLEFGTEKSMSFMKGIFITSS